MSMSSTQRYIEFLDGQRSYFLASDISEFNIYRDRFGDMIRTGEHRSGVSDLRTLPAAQPRAHGTSDSPCCRPSPTGP